jgi:hypothetical protein
MKAGGQLHGTADSPQKKIMDFYMLNIVVGVFCDESWPSALSA